MQLQTTVAKNFIKTYLAAKKPKPSAFAVLKLADKGNIVKDGKHKLTIYKAFSQKAGEPAYAYLEDYYGKFPVTLLFT